MQCTVSYTPPSSDLGGSAYYEVPVQCGSTKSTLRLLSTEKQVEIRAFSDWTFMEVYFQKGRVAMTAVNAMNDNTGISLSSTADVTATGVAAYPMQSIWVSEEAVRKAPRAYSASASHTESVVV